MFLHGCRVAVCSPAQTLLHTASQHSRFSCSSMIAMRNKEVGESRIVPKQEAGARVQMGSKEPPPGAEGGAGKHICGSKHTTPGH